MDACYIGTAADAILRGVRNEETGYRITGIDHNFDDPREYNNDTDGTPIGFTSGSKKALEITINGKISGETPDVTALPFDFPCDGGTVTVANLISGYGIAAGGVYLMNLKITEADDADASFSATLTRHPNIA